jgi:hypothetical protein
MAIELLFGRKSPGKVGNLELDAMLTERQSFANDVTNFPIESGSSISDHVIQAPEEVEVEGFVTNTPIEFISGLRSGQEDRVLNAYLMLLEIAGYKSPGKAYRFNKLETVAEDEQYRPEFKLVEILTGLRLYTDMALIKLDIPRDAKTGDTIKFTALFRKVNTVELTNVPRIPDKVSEKNPSADRTKKQTPEAKDAGKSGTLESIADKFIDKIRGISD